MVTMTASQIYSEVEDEFSEFVRHPKNWFLLTGNRLLISAVILVFLIVVFDLLVYEGFASLKRGTGVYYLLGGLISGNATLIGLVITINQVIVSRQLGSPGELREQISNVTDYRESVLEETEIDVVPVTPSEFLEILLQSARREIQRVGGLVYDASDEERYEEIDDFVTELTTHVDEVSHQLEQSGIGTFNTLVTTLTTNYAQYIHRAREYQALYHEAHAEQVTNRFEQLVIRLQQLDVGRQYFKTLYTQTELAYLSRVLLYTGFISEFVLAVLLLLYTSPKQGSALPATLPSLLVPTAVGIGFTPLAVLVPFVIRLSMVTERTAAITPFTTPEQEQ